MASSFRRAAELTSEALARGLRERFVEPGALRSATRRAARPLLRGVFETVEIGDAEAGMQLASGAFRLAGREVLIADPGGLWSVSPPSTAWREAAHRFVWMRDLAAVGDEAAARLAIGASYAWIKRFGQSYDPLVWRPDVAAERLAQWIHHAELLAYDVADDATMAALSVTMAQHAEWLDDHQSAAPPGVPRLRVASAAMLAAIAFDGWEARIGRASAALETAIATSLRGDGGVVGRRPDAPYTALTMLLAVRDAYEAVDLAPPQSVLEAIAKLAAAVRFFRLGDGGAPLFHGGRAIDDGRIDLALSVARSDGSAPKAMTESGYARMSGGRVVVILDVGRAPGAADAETAHASCLGFEMISGRRRIVVNCGSGVTLDSDWRRACRASAAHSTIIVDNQSSAGPALTGRWRAFGEDLAIVGPPETHAERKEERNGVWILGAHDGYFDLYGLTVTRRMFLSVDGGDFRGEDSLEALDDGARVFERRLGALRGKGVPFDARFHLHPDVVAEIVADGEAITLKLPHGEVWVMRQAGGRLALEPSVYLPDDGPVRRAWQIVVSGVATKKDTQLRWAFRRVGEISQLPLDVDALIAAVEPGLAPPGAGDDVAPENILNPARG